MISKTLRTWFAIHFFADIIFAIPLLIAPIWTLNLLGFNAVEPYAARLVGAALFGIGTASWIGRNKGVESYRSMLLLKSLWSIAAIVGILLSLYEQPVLFGYIALGIFILFSSVWNYFFFKLM